MEKRIEGITRQERGPVVNDATLAVCGYPPEYWFTLIPIRASSGEQTICA